MDKDNSALCRMWFFAIDDGVGYRYAQTIRCTETQLDTQLPKRLQQFVTSTNRDRARFNNDIPAIDIALCSITELQAIVPINAFAHQPTAAL